MRTSRRNWITALALVLMLGAGWWYRTTRPAPRAWTGGVMGTRYSVQVADPLPEHRADALRREVHGRLREIDGLMSTWNPESPLSRFNDHAATNPVPIPQELHRVVAAALETARASGGAFDPTVAPLLAAWGFGPKAEDREPGAAELAALRARTGPERLRILPSSKLRKTHPGLELDLGGIAKGYGADAASAVLRGGGVSNYLVEVGGEVRLRGHHSSGEPWRIGVERPGSDASGAARLQGVMQLTNGAVATSGDYRNYRLDEKGRRLPHLLDPRAGRPVRSDVAGVTVLADDAMTADALATALFVMGPGEGLRWIESRPEEALFLVRSNGVIREIPGSGFIERAGYQASDD